MPKLRIIPRLEVKSENVVKGIRMEGLRVVGQPAEMASRLNCFGLQKSRHLEERLHRLSLASRYYNG